MIKPIIKDTFFLSMKSEPAVAADQDVITDLLDTLKANEASCAGLAANMIGVHKCIIAVNIGIVDLVMLNPVIIEGKGEFSTREACLSLEGERDVKRYQTITVEFEDSSFKKQRQTFTGWTAQIIQHEIDHCNGILI